jgi:hypothetical protein
LNGALAKVAAVLEALSKAAFERDVGRLNSRTAQKYDWTVVTAQYPVFDVIFNHTTAAPLRVRFTCDDWDDRPPSTELLDEAGVHLTTPPPNVVGIFHPGPHHRTGHPFVCMRGTREYHTHESHVSDDWANYRGQDGNDILGLTVQIWRAWKRAVK